MKDTVRRGVCRLAASVFVVIGATAGFGAKRAVFGADVSGL